MSPVVLHLTFWRHATVLPQRNHLLRDFITQVFLRSLQYGIVVMGFPHQHFRLPKIKARYPYLPKDRSTTRTRGTDFRGWSFHIDGGTRIVNGETLAGWCVISRSHHGRIDIMFGPVVTTEAHLAFSGASTLQQHC